MNLTHDAKRHLLTKVATKIANPVTGDTDLVATYADYKDIGGAKFPMKIGQRQGGYPIFDLNVSEAKANAPVSIQPPQGRGAGPGGAPAPGSRRDGSHAAPRSRRN